jgi:cold shock CspA family protein
MAEVLEVVTVTVAVVTTKTGGKLSITKTSAKRRFFIFNQSINMAKSKETFNKKEKEKKRMKQRQEKREKMEQRKANASKGQSLEDMMAYLDEDGNIVSAPPDPRKKKEFKAEDMVIGVAKHERDETEDLLRKGTVSYFDDKKGFGFIIDKQTGERVFVHINHLSEPLRMNDTVSYEVERGHKGMNAVNVKKI